jgi:hypothetical protein
MTEQINDLFADIPQEISTNYVVTSRRNLIRILDIGLIVPELVASNKSKKVQLIAADELGQLQSIGSTLSVPVLLEVEEGLNETSLAHSVESIKAIHFSSTSEKEDYLARVFENVPNELFKFKVSPDLFSADKVASALFFGKLNKQKLGEKYRKVDVFSGLFWQYLVQMQSAEKVMSQLSNIISETEEYFLSAGCVSRLIAESSDINIEPDVQVTLSHYLEVISSADLDEGWAAKNILQTLKEMHKDSIKPQDLFSKWHDISIEIVNNERDLIPLTDDKQIVLRAMLLHVLNPDEESINRMALRKNPPGKKVQLVAKLFAAARDGFSAMLAKDKTKLSGAYFLISSLAAGCLNKQPLTLEKLSLDTENNDIPVLKWNGQLLGEFTEALVSKEPEEVGLEVSEHLSSEVPTVLSVDGLVDTLLSIEFVAKAAIVDGSAELTLDKKLIKPAVLPRHAAFAVYVENDELILQTCLLDLSIASHGKKLTGPKMREILEYQSVQSRDFCFDLYPGENFMATVRVKAKQVDKDTLVTVLQQLVDVQVWMKK